MIDGENSIFSVEKHDSFEKVNDSISPDKIIK